MFYFVKVRPNGGTEWCLMTTDGGLKSTYVRSAIKQGVGQLLHRHLEAGGKVVVTDAEEGGNILLEVVVNPPR